jgi:hypothetical protein
VQKHYRSGNMQALQKKYAADVVWLAVNSTNKSQLRLHRAARLRPQLKGFRRGPRALPDGRPGHHGMAYGAKTTPHMYIIDPSGKLVYNGAIDDKRSTNRRGREGREELRRRALEDMKAGKPVSVASTTPYGCTVKYR